MDVARAQKWRQNVWDGRWVRVRCGALGVRARDDDDDDDDVCDDVRVTRMCAYAPRSAVTRHTRRRRRRRRRRRPSSVVIIIRAPITRPSSLVRPMMIPVVAHHIITGAMRYCPLCVYAYSTVLARACVVLVVRALLYYFVC